jgi:hypothetical protein
MKTLLLNLTTLVFFVFAIAHCSLAQSVTLTPDGAWVPSYTTTARTAITPTDGQLVYDTDTKSFWYGKSTVWTEITSGTSSNYFTANGSAIYNNNSGNVGIGTTTPTEKLEVDGKVKTTNLQITDGATNGYVLQSDASGNTSWLNPALRYVGTSFLGQTSGYGSTGTSEGTSSNLYNIAIGASVLNANTTGNNNVALGQNALKANTIGREVVAIGHNALQNHVSSLDGSSTSNVYGPDLAIGTDALSTETASAGNTAIGYQSQKNTDNGFGASANTSVGSYALRSNGSGANNTAIGFSALYLTSSGVANTAIGNGAGVTNTTGSGNTFIGGDADATSNNLTYATAIGKDAKVASSNSLVLGGTGSAAVKVGIGTTSPSEVLDVIGKTKTTTFQMTTSPTSGYVLQSDASGNGTWVNPSTFSSNNWTTSGTNQYSALSGNVGIGTTSPSSKLHVTGNMQIDAGKLEFKNVGGSVFIGESAGSSDDLSINYNAFVGFNAGKVNTSGENHTALGAGALENNTTGNSNTAIGRLSLLNNTTGSDNVALGLYAGNTNTTGSFNTYIGRYAGGKSTGSYNVFLGNTAGENETGSDKLYIDNSNTSSPLIYGDFLTNKLTINDYLTSKYFQMTNGATTGYVLQSDASGNATWVNPTTLSNGNWTTSGSNQYSALSGNIGIGTSSPTNKLDIQSSSSVTANVQSSGNSAYVSTAAPSASETAFAFKTYASGSLLNRWLFGKSNTSESGSDAGSDFFINRYNDAGVYQSQPLSISRASGTVTIPTLKTTTFQMTTSPANGSILKSDASGNGTWTALSSAMTAGTGLSWSGTTLNSLWTQSSSTNSGGQYTTYNNSNNYVGIGTSSADYMLTVSESLNGGGFYPVAIVNSSNSSTNQHQGLLIKAGTTSANYNSSHQSHFVMFQNPSGGAIGSIQQTSGSGISFQTSSDRRLKENIVATQYGLKDVLTIEVKDYNYKGDKTPQTGFIAQQLHAVYPNVVHVGGADVTKDPWTVDYGKLTPLLVKAIQDQQAEIEALKAQNAAFKAQVEKTSNDNASIKSDFESLKSDMATIKAELSKLNSLRQ